MIDYIETLIQRRMVEIEQQEDSNRRELEIEVLLLLTNMYRDGTIEACVDENGELVWSIADLPFTTIGGEE